MTQASGQQQQPTAVQPAKAEWHKPTFTTIPITDTAGGELAPLLYFRPFK